MEVYETEVISPKNDLQEINSDDKPVLVGRENTEEVKGKRAKQVVVPGRNLSFNQFEADKMQRDNDKILKNLIDIQIRDPKFKPQKPPALRPHHAAINRKKQNVKIEYENHQMLNRLLTAKSTLNTRPANPRPSKTRGSKSGGSAVSLPAQKPKTADPSKWEKG